MVALTPNWAWYHQIEITFHQGEYDMANSVKSLILLAGLASCLLAEPLISAAKAPKTDATKAPVTSSSTVYSDPNKTIMLEKNAPEFTLKLLSNPTTGYSWMLSEYHPEFIKPISRRYESPKAGLLGAGGMDLWTFSATPQTFRTPHLLTLTLTYVQPWSLDDRKTVTFHIATSGAG